MPTDDLRTLAARLEEAMRVDKPRMCMYCGDAAPASTENDGCHSIQCLTCGARGPVAYDKPTSIHCWNMTMRPQTW